MDLTDRNQIFPFFENTLEPYQRRVIRYQFDTLNHELASNQYGYAFLMTKPTSKTTFDLYLGVISFFAQQESRVFKVMKVASNQLCLSLSEESALVGDAQDELVVSFVCNTQLYIVKSCLKPRLVMNLRDYAGDATKTKQSRPVPGAL